MMMETDIQPETELSPPSPIRVETALSRYPVHRLAKKGIINISLTTHKKTGEPSLDWTVSHNSQYGQPGPLAYKLDTLIINRCIEEAPRPIPRLIRLGGLRDISGAVRRGKTGNTADIKTALHQNASTYITAKIQYKLASGGERRLETGFTRYSVIFAGEELPDGRKADAVYIVLSDVYLKVLNGAMTRPLDYEYLKSLPPAPQRFYELLSYQMYAAIKNDRARARLTYSEFCNCAPQTRHCDWLRVRTQMNKLYAPHRASGYIADIDYEQTTDDHGQPDWIMLYKPGPKARADYRAFNKRGGPVMLEADLLEIDPLPQLAVAELSPLAAKLAKRGVTETAAAALVTEYPAFFIEAKIEQFDYEMLQPKPPKRPAGFLVRSIRDGYKADPTFISRGEREQRAEAARHAHQEAVEAGRIALQQKISEKAAWEAAEAKIKQLSPEDRAALQAMLLAQASEQTRQMFEQPPTPTYPDTLMHRMMLHHFEPSIPL